MNFCPTSHSFLSDSRQAVSTYLCLVKGIPLVWMPRALVWAFWPDAASCLKLHHTSHATKCCVARVQAQKSAWLSRFHQQILGLEILNHDKMTCCVRMYETCPGWQDTAYHLFAPPVHRTGAPRYASFSPGREHAAPFRRPIKRWGGGCASPSEKERCVGFLDLCGLGCRPNFIIKIVDVFWDKSRLN